MYGRLRSILMRRFAAPLAPTGAYDPIVIAQLPATCCDSAEWCRVCGGRRGGPLLGVAFCAAMLDAEALYEKLRYGRLPSEWPGDLEQAIGRMAITADGRPRLQRWLAENYLATARAHWCKLVTRTRL